MSACISWRTYDEQYKLSELLTDAARACVDVHASEPKEYLASYFVKACRGDAVEELYCEPLLTPEGEVGVGLHLRLFTNVEAHTATTRIGPQSQGAERDEGAIAANSSHTDHHVIALNFIEHLAHDFLPQLQQIGCSAQEEWDAVVVKGKDTVTWPSHVLSLAAAIAAAKSMRLSLYQHIRALYLKTLLAEDIINCNPVTLDADALFFMPQLVIPFFGSVLDRHTATGSIYIHTLYLLPGVSATSVSDIKRDRVVSAELLCKIGSAYRVLAKRRGTNTSSHATVALPTVREDGAYILDCPLESVVDAVALASEVLQQVGIKPGKEVCFGVRLQCPKVQRSVPEGSTGTIFATHGLKEASIGKKQVSSGPRKKPFHHSAGGTPDIMYSLHPGDTDVTGAQVALYLSQQVEKAGGTLVYLEDTHTAQDEEGLHRLQGILKEQYDWKGIVSGYGLYDCQDKQYDLEERISAGIQRVWSQNLALCPDTVGSITRLMRLGQTIRMGGRAISMVQVPHVRPAEAVVDLAVGTGTSFLILSSLQLPSACEVVSRFLSMQSSLLRARSLGEPPAWGIFFPKDLPAVPKDIVIPEIRRKNDKKRKAGK
ncbi:unnamed protein product [Phytomonas sp. EM1]|nr:unnamed protein product [Phytomonas sp. EM1]|eukprot:CCW60287.1 unnamed protein product [Phytomonas sp. isolate EM1]